MTNTIKISTRLLLVVSILKFTYADAQDTIKRTGKKGYNLALYLSVIQENYDNLRAVPFYNNTPSNTTLMFGGALSVGNQRGLFFSGYLAFNFWKRTGSYENYSEYTVTNMRVNYGGNICYSVYHKNEKFSIVPFIGSLFGETYICSAEGNKFSNNWSYLITQSWIIHSGIMLATTHPGKISYFAQIGYDISTGKSKWYYATTPISSIANVNMGGPFIEIGISAWNN